MAERRYSEEEVAAIFKQAAHPTASQRLGGTSGLTLPELQHIASEVGLSAESVSRAAAMIDAQPTQITRRFMGLPITVGRSVKLEREMSDTEWERLVVDLRMNFNARGRVESQGNLRHWWNGNLHVMVEPGNAGQQVRMQTTWKDARNMMMTGLIAMGGGAVMAAMRLLSLTSDPSFLQAATILGAGGAIMFVATALRLPSWGRERREQMEAIAARLETKTSHSPTGL